MYLTGIPLSIIPSVIAVEVDSPPPVQRTNYISTLESCQVCGQLKFGSIEDKRAHFRSDWHAFNLGRKIKGQITVTESEFDQLVETESLGSLDASESEEEETDGISYKNSPFYGFKVSMDGILKQMLIYKQVLCSKKEMSMNDWPEIAKSRLESMIQKPSTWIFFMMGSGHFAGAVYDLKTRKCIAHKTFHRYTTRKKQGGSQSSHDTSKGKAKSAGANLRRYNEQALKDDVQSLLKTWKDYIKNCQLIFTRLPTMNRSTFFFDDQLLKSDDLRIRSIPFTTRRATLQETARCLEVLSTVIFADIEQVKPKRPKEDDTMSILTVPESLSEPIPQPSVPQLDKTLVKAIEFITKGKLELFKTHIHKNSIDVSVELPDEEGISFLHIASKSDEPDIVQYLLEAQVNPTKRGMHRKTTAYDVAASKTVRDVFRRYAASHPDQWDYKSVGIDQGLTEEMEIKQKEKLLEKQRKKEERRRKLVPQEPIAQPEPQMTALERSMAKARVSKLGAMALQEIGMTPEMRQRLDREKR